MARAETVSVVVRGDPVTVLLGDDGEGLDHAPTADSLSLAKRQFCDAVPGVRRVRALEEVHCVHIGGDR